MFGWLKKTAPLSDADKKRAEVTAHAMNVIVPAYGGLMERYAGSIADASVLPLAKDKMKIALKLAWLANEDRKYRDLIGAAFVCLADFQPGVGSVPLSLTPPADLAAAKEWFSRIEGLMKTTTEETQELYEEFRVFTGSAH